MAVTHIGSTGVKSVNTFGKCLYSGSGCNAAPLLREDVRELADIYGSWPQLAVNKYVPKNNAAFIEQLQSAHDDSDPITFKSDYDSRMLKLAKTYGLDSTILDNLGW
ncbi:hypothetical protein Xoosp13_7 [Xanthomonas phage Xoo-sp13]|nr:hypothetical protein Xoosp13_7 [Xanthomonas phage Xoo-sp13]